MFLSTLSQLLSYQYPKNVAVLEKYEEMLNLNAKICIQKLELGL